MDRKLRDSVRNRAGNRCEYCRLRQEHSRVWRHQIEHVLPRKHGGTDDEDNLALACVRCNLCKASNLSGIDGDTRQIVALFNPARRTGSTTSATMVAGLSGSLPAAAPPSAC